MVKVDSYLKSSSGAVPKIRFRVVECRIVGFRV